MNNVSISIIDYLDLINYGVSLILSLKLGDDIFEMIYWVDLEDTKLLVGDSNLLKKLNVEKLSDYSGYDKLISYIGTNVVNDPKIFIDELKNKRK